MASIPATTSPPKRGGNHPTYGEFIGGSKMNDNYELVDTSMQYRFTTQCRNRKSTAAIEKSLREARDSNKEIKFNGTLEPVPGRDLEIGKERFVTLLKKRVKEHGQQTFYHILDDTKVVDLFDNAHRFKLDQVIKEHNRRLMLDETKFETYDQIERDDIELSRLVVESFLSESFQEKIEIRFSHRDDYETLPGSCLFIMALETCNASAFHDIEGAKKLLDSLTLDSYPGEEVTSFTSEAQRLIKIMQGAYALPVNTGSNLIGKLTSTSSEFFNRKMWALMDTVMTLEMEFELSDPRLFTQHDDYSVLGPLGIIAVMQATHGTLLSQHKWPALTSQLPQINHTPVLPTPPSTYAGAVLNGRRCYRCGGEHLIRNCPNPAPPGWVDKSGTNSSGAGPSPPTSNQPIAPPDSTGNTGMAAWRYI